MLPITTFTMLALAIAALLMHAGHQDPPASRPPPRSRPLILRDLGPAETDALVAQDSSPNQNNV